MKSAALAGARVVALVVVAAGAAAPVRAAPANVEQALTLIKGVCALPGAALDITPAADGWLTLRIALPDGRRASTALANRDLDSFAETSQAQQSRQPFELSACMEPYVNQVIATLMRLPERVAGAAAPPGVSPVPNAPPAVGAFQPPVVPQAPAPAYVPPRPAAPAYPAGDLPVGVILGTTAAAAAPSPAASPADGAAPRGAISFRVAGCRATGRDVICDVKVSNDTALDYRVVVQGSYTKLYGADGSAINASWALMGNQRDDMRYGKREAVVKVIADTAPVLSVLFHAVPEVLNTIKRLEISVGPQTTNGVELQKLTLADVQIQGR